MTQKLTAQVVPYSSVVGTGVMVLENGGPCVAMVSIRATSADIPKETQQALANLIAAAINQLGQDEGENDDE